MHAESPAYPYYGQAVQESKAEPQLICEQYETGENRSKCIHYWWKHRGGHCEWHFWPFPLLLEYDQYWLAPISMVYVHEEIFWTQSPSELSVSQSMLIEGKRKKNNIIFVHSQTACTPWTGHNETKFWLLGSPIQRLLITDANDKLRGIS